jgi:radical SAM superfamily enzyme YgiQ (UPF0313 family)
MKVLLVYPPFVTDNKAFPPLSLPALTAWLRQKKVEVWQKDLNIEFLNYLTTPAVISRLRDRLQTLNRDYQTQPPDSLDTLRHLCDLGDALRVWLPWAETELRRHGNQLKAMEGGKSSLVLERLADAALLDLAYPKDRLEVSTDDLLKELRLERPSALDRFMENFVIESVLPFKPDVVGLSLMTEQQFFPGLTLAWYLKKLAPDVHVTAGGGFVSAVADKIGRHGHDIFSLVDTFISFDGEIALSALLDRLAQGGEPEGIPNVVWFDRRLQEVRYAPPQESGSLDHLPLPDFEDLDMGLYTRSILPYYVTKGCSFGRCAYCSDPFYSSARHRSPAMAVDHIERLVNRYHIKTLMFVDSYINPEKLEPIAAEMVRRGIKVNWLMQTRMDRFLTTERLKLFAESGCRELWFGMETVNRRMIKLIRKGTTKDIIMRILGDCRANSIRVTLNCMIGFPTETEEEADETIQFVDSLNNIYPDLVFKCNTGLVFVPRLAPFGQQPDKFGITVVEEFEWSPRLEWVPPDWRYKERFRKLEGRIFERTYKTASEVQDEVRGAGQSLSPNSSVQLSDTCYLQRANLDVIGLWKKFFAFDEMAQAAQRQNRQRKDAVMPSIDALIAADLRQWAAEERQSILAYVVDRDHQRRIVPLSPIYALLINCIAGETTVAEIQKRMARHYPQLAAAQIESSVLFGLNYLLQNGVIRVTAETGVETEDGGERYFVRNNFGEASSAAMSALAGAVHVTSDALRE